MWWHTRRNKNFVFRRNGRVHLNRRGRQFSRLLAAEVCSSAVVPCSEVVCRVLATHSIRQFPLHFPSHASPCAITFQLDSTKGFCLHSAIGTGYELASFNLSTHIGPQYPLVGLHKSLGSTEFIFCTLLHNVCGKIKFSLYHFFELNTCDWLFTSAAT
jgi:hypothetical protein